MSAPSFGHPGWTPEQLAQAGQQIQPPPLGTGPDRLAKSQQRARRCLSGSALVGVVEDPALGPRVGHAGDGSWPGVAG